MKYSTLLALSLLVLLAACQGTTTEEYDTTENEHSEETELVEEEVCGECDVMRPGPCPEGQTHEMGEADECGCVTTYECVEIQEEVEEEIIEEELFCADEATGDSMTLEEAQTIAQASECAEYEFETNDIYPRCNNNYHGWQFRLVGGECAAHCNVYHNGTAEIAWMCTGALI